MFGRRAVAQAVRTWRPAGLPVSHSNARSTCGQVRCQAYGWIWCSAQLVRMQCNRQVQVFMRWAGRAQLSASIDAHSTAPTSRDCASPTYTTVLTEGIHLRNSLHRVGLGKLGQTEPYCVAFTPKSTHCVLLWNTPDTTGRSFPRQRRTAEQATTALRCAALPSAPDPVGHGGQGHHHQEGACNLLHLRQVA